jgi:N-acetylglucosaminyldiphosphoundecaprenol N-acetyl-beta-D-mannosaminyltransferase
VKSEHLILPEKYPVLGVGISELTFNEAISLFLHAAATREKVRANFCSVNNIVEADRDPAMRAQMASSQIVAPDGMPLVWLGRLRGRQVDRVCGPDLMLRLCERSQEFGYRHFFYGGAEGVAEQLAENLQRRFPALQVAGTYTPPFRPLTDDEDEQVVVEINGARPDLVWVGLSTPKQDGWIATHQSRLEAPVLLAVGAAFDFHTGRVRRAPTWIQRIGLEWLFRLSMEPKRLWRRYLVGNTLFVLYLASEALGFRRFH